MYKLIKIQDEVPRTVYLILITFCLLNISWGVTVTKSRIHVCYLVLVEKFLMINVVLV